MINVLDPIYLSKGKLVLETYRENELSQIADALHCPSDYFATA